MIHYPSSLAAVLAISLLVPPWSVEAVPLGMPSSPTVLPASGSQAQAKVDDGLKSLHADDLAAAEAAFREAARIDPKLASAYIGLAEVAGRQNKPARVEYWLQQALAAEPANATVQRVWGRQQHQSGRYVEAEAAFKKAVALDPQSAEAQINLAENYLFGLKKAKLAESAYRAAIALEGGNAQAHLGLAATLGALGRPDDALLEYEMAVKLAPQDPKYRLAQARYYSSRAKFDQALVVLQEAIALDPAFLPAYIDRGDLFLAKNDLEQAVATYRAAIKAVPGAAIAYFRLGTVFEGQRRWADAEQAYLDAIKIQPAMFAAYNNLAYMAAVRKEKLDDALTWAKKAIELAPKMTTLQDTLGWVHYARGELVPAAQALEKAVAGNPKKASFHYHLGVVYQEQGKKKEAIAALRKALELDREFSQAADIQKRLHALGSK